jgi:PAS domain S-box-containing protein
MMEKRKTILVVDDVPDEIAVLEEILKPEYQVKAATSGEAALTLVAGDPPDLILLDIIMPGMDGFEVCRRLKQDSVGASIPVIFLTARVKTIDESLGLQLGAVDYIRKPVEPDIVRRRIKTQLETRDEALKSSELRYRRLFETSKAAILIIDAATGKIIDANPATTEMLGCSQEFFLDAHIGDLAFLNGILGERKALADPSPAEFVRNKKDALHLPDGRRIFVESMLNSYEANHRHILQLNMWDVTSLVQAERERDELSARLTHYLATSPTVTYALSLSDGKLQWRWISENIIALLGYTAEEALAPDWWLSNVNSADRVAALGLISDIAKRETASREYRFLRKDGRSVWLRDEMRLIKGSGQESEIVGTLTDISDRKKAEEEIYLKSAALDAAANAVVIAGRDGRILWANPAFETLTGYSRGESRGKSPKELVNSAVQNEEFYRSLWATILAGKVWTGILVNRRKTGEQYAEEMTITPVLDETDQVVNFVAVKTDITERENARKRLEVAIQEKNEMLRELHHRVNNNMQVLVSLLGISAQGIGDAELRGKLEDITRRMHAMAIIHERFYESRDMLRIDFSSYLRCLLEDLGAEFPLFDGKAALECETGAALLGLDQAVPAGLIVAELLSNCLKFAFPAGTEAGEIRIIQRVVGEDVLEIEVRDDGVGLPSDLDPKTARSLGMVLIFMLARQLGGKVNFSVEGGTRAVLGFPIAPVANR